MIEKNEQLDQNVSNNHNTHFELLCSMVEQLDDQLPQCELNYSKRDYCKRCDRPVNVCLCDFLPDKMKIEKNLKIWIFQHPKEEKRILRTTRILEKCLSEKNFEILKSKKFTVEKFPQLKQVYENLEWTFVLYPSETSINLEQFSDLIKNTPIRKNESKEEKNTDERFFNVILIDGTWAQASGIYFTNLDLQKFKQIKIDNIDFTSAYTIRTQPREFFLSTLETCAIILSKIEEKPNIYHDLVKPLEALCNYQFDHGAKPHQSKEWLIFNGLYKKPLSKKNFNKLTKNSKFLEACDSVASTDANIDVDNLKKNYEHALNDLVVTTNRKQAT